MEVFLETDRLILRRFTEADVDNVVELDSDPEVMRYINGGHPTPRDKIQNDYLPWWIAYYTRFAGYGFWAAIEKSSGEFLGWFHFRPFGDADVDEPELGYRLRKSAWGKGYATEGSRALIRKGFVELGVRRVTASADAINIGSRRVMEKSGMVLVRTFLAPRPDESDGEVLEAVEYALDRTDWQGQSDSHSSSFRQ
jgi:RimJ/RimL family protein N-acetyltransferase